MNAAPCAGFRFWFLPLLCLLAVSHAAEANTLTVPQEYPTIQAAINASANGDTVLISDGTYTGPGNVDLDFGGRNITVTSVHGPNSTIIDCAGTSSANHRGFYLHSGETNAAISGLTIENGYEGSKRGLESDGGGILNSGVGLTVQSCVLKNNTAGFGGGIVNADASGGTMSVTNCILTGNAASRGAGGIFNLLNESSATIAVNNCILVENSGGVGGGILNENGGSGSITVTNCTLIDNSTGTEGGGIFNGNYSNGSAKVTNCTFTGNSATNGGGLYNINFSGTNTVTNCTFTDNSVSGSSADGGGIHNDSEGNGTITLTNNILFGDANSEIAGSSSTVTYCDIQGGYTGTGNIDADPLFVNAPTDLHLQPGSPCLGAGTPDGAPTTTIDGRTRPDPPSIGAYEVGQGLASLRVYRFIVSGGSSASLTGSLTQKADSDAIITLTSSDPAALSVPSSTLIRRGYTKKTFTAASHPVTRPTIVTVTATYNGVRKTATVTVAP